MVNLLLLGFPVLNFASRETMANEPRTGRDRVLAISGSQSPRFSHIERINYISRRGPVFAAREDADELPKDREGSRPRDPWFAESKVFSYRANKLYLKAGTVFAAREDARPPGTEAPAPQDAWSQRD